MYTSDTFLEVAAPAKLPYYEQMNNIDLTKLFFQIESL